MIRLSALIQRFLLFSAVLVAFFLGPMDHAKVQAQNLSFIRDAEIENTIRIMATPLLRVAGLDPASVELFIINDNSLNAFVAGGQKVFMNTGLLMRSDNASQVIGVLAHEIGHISGGHLSRTGDAIAKSITTSIITMLLGSVAAVAADNPDIGTAILLGGQQVSQRAFLSYTRTQESAADQAAMTFLDRTGQSSEGFYQFLKILEGQELLVTARQDAYVRTHPLTQTRIDSIEAHLKDSPYSKSPTPLYIETLHHRMKAKLEGFLNPISLTLRQYPESDQSLFARYARAIAYYRRPDLEKALQNIDSLIKEFPDDPYFHEMKGQMLFENARPIEALKSYELALKYLSESPLILTQIARIQLGLNEPKYTRAAISYLKKSLQIERRSSFSWRQLGIAYHREGNAAESSLAFGEASLLKGENSAAKFHAGKAVKVFPRGSPGWLQAQDIIQEIERREKKIERSRPF